jgi:hypothetical protein
MGGYAKAVSEQRFGKHVPAAIDTNATTEELCFLRGPCRELISKGQGQLSVVSCQLKVSSVRESVKTELEPEAEEWPLWSRYKEPPSNRLRTLDCVLE